MYKINEGRNCIHQSVPHSLLLFQLFQCSAELIWATGIFSPAANSIQFMDNAVYRLTNYQLGYSLEIAIATTSKLHLLNYIILISNHLNQL